jgi:hypothetical protein
VSLSGRPCLPSMEIPGTVACGSSTDHHDPCVPLHVFRDRPAVRELVSRGHPHKPPPARFNVDTRRENSSIRPPKQPFLSLSTCFSPSGKRSAFQKRPLAYISEPALCRIPPNGAHSEVSQNICAGI